MVLALTPATPSVEEWRALRDAIPPQSSFLAGRWIEPWRRHLLGQGNWNEPFRYLTVRNEDGELLGVVPLAEQRAGPVVVQSLAGYFIPFRGMPVAQSAADTFGPTFANFMTEHYRDRTLRMAPVPAWNRACQSVLLALTQRGWRVRTKHHAYRQVIRLPHTFEEYANERRGSRWSTIARRWRKWQREQNVELKSFATPACGDWDPVIRDMGLVEQQSWLATEGGDTHFVATHHHQYWSEVLNSGERAPNTRAWVLYQDGQPVAFNFNIDAGPCRYYMAGHYAEHVKRYSAGGILLRVMIQDAIERGVEFVDMGGGDPGYKAFWGSRPDGELIECMAFPPTLKGRVLDLAFLGLETAKRLKTRLRKNG